MAGKFNWSAYQPSKAIWFWSCAGCVIATVAIGFTWGGWVTGGTASEMATDARENGRATLAANLCVDRFMAAPDVADQMAALDEESRYRRDDFIEAGGWTSFAGVEGSVSGAAQACADRLAEMDVPVADVPVIEESAADEVIDGDADETAVN